MNHYQYPSANFPQGTWSKSQHDLMNKQPFSDFEDTTINRFQQITVSHSQMPPANHYQQTTLNRSSPHPMTFPQQPLHLPQQQHSANHFQYSTTPNHSSQQQQQQQPMNHFQYGTLNHPQSAPPMNPPPRSAHPATPSQHAMNPPQQMVVSQQPLQTTPTVRGGRDYATLQDELLRSRALYTDPTFPPNNTSLYTPGSPHYDRFSGTVIWKRPKDIVKNPKLMYHGASRNDLDQGNLGNCWFVAGAAVLATSNPQLMARVVPDDQGFEQDRYTGMFHFNFWWYVNWTEVIVDDFIPTDGYRPIYCSNRERPDEFWPCLLEKAYAKLHGSYQNLVGGNMQTAMVDMTGGISEVIDLQKKNEVSPELYSLLIKSCHMKTLMGAAIFLPPNARGNSEVRRSNGLYMGHAYSITGFQQIPTGRGTVNLMRLRNPWGKGEWNGPWSDNSPEMAGLSRQMKEQLGFHKLDDGEFWMNYEDFVFNVDQLQMCHLSPDAFLAEIAENDKKQQWNVTAFHDSWIRGLTAGGCGNPPYQALKWKNPQFYVTLEHPDNVLGHGDDCTLIVSLMQHIENKKPVAIGFEVYKLKDPSLRPPDGSRAPKSHLSLTERSGMFDYNRQVAKRFELKCGTYAIMPSTFKPHEESDFLLRLVTENRVDSGVLDDGATPTPNPPVTPSPKPQDPFEEFFDRHANSDNKLDAEELKAFLLDISTSELQEPLKFSLESCRSIVTLMDNNKSGLLEVEEARRAWKEIKAYRTVFKHFDADNNNKMVTYELGNVFSKLASIYPGFPVSRGVITAMVRRYGDRNNTISLTDFILLVCKLTSLYAAFHRQERRRGTSNGNAEFSLNEFLEVTMYT